MNKEEKSEKVEKRQENRETSKHKQELNEKLIRAYLSQINGFGFWQQKR